MSDPYRKGPLRIGGIVVPGDVLGASRGERCRIEECRAACCSNGIWMDAGHAERLREHAGDIAPHLPPDRRDPAEWFDGEIEDTDFPTGRGVGSAVVDDPEDEGRTVCVFLRPDLKCALQAASAELGLEAPGLKPFYCALYPVLLSEGELVMDRWSPGELHGADCQRACAGRKRSLVEVFREELELAVGTEGYRALCLARAARGSGPDEDDAADDDPEDDPDAARRRGR